ncbi:hypothetical protein EI555_000370, partial [Monodon monoceros]
GSALNYSFVPLRHQKSSCFFKTFDVTEHFKRCFVRQCFNKDVRIRPSLPKVLCSHARSTFGRGLVYLQASWGLGPGAGAAGGQKLASPPLAFLPALLLGSPEAQVLVCWQTDRQATNVTQLLGGQLWSEAPAQLETTVGGEGKEEKGRGEQRRGGESRGDLHGALESSQGGQMPDACHQPLCLGNRQDGQGQEAAGGRAGGAEPCSQTSGTALLGLAMATAAVLTYFGPRFAVIGHASSQRTRYEALHLWGITLAALLTLGAVLSTAATVREAGGLMAGAFLCFALAFCVLVQVAFWRCHNPTQVEDAVLDAYDQVYEQAVKSSSGIWRQELVAIQDMFQCCGKSPPFGLPEGSQADLCRGQEAARQDCLQGIRNVLRTHRNIASTLISLGLASMVYVMPLSAFLWFAIRSGKYTLSPRARGCQPQEPHFYRRCREGPAPPHLSEAGAVGVQAVARVTLRCPRTPTRLHTGATETLRPWPARHPSQEGMSCFPPHGGGMGREGTPPDKQPPCKQTGDRASLADSGNRLG